MEKSSQKKRRSSPLIVESAAETNGTRAAKNDSGATDSTQKVLGNFVESAQKTATRKNTIERTTEEEKKRFSERLQRELAEQDRVEQMNAQRRRMKLLEHSREVRRLADEKFAAKEAALEMERRELEARRREREAVDAAIESERAKMLQEFESRRG